MDKLVILGKKYAQEVYRLKLDDIVQLLNDEASAKTNVIPPHGPANIDDKLLALFTAEVADKAAPGVVALITNLDENYPASPDSDIEFAYFKDGFGQEAVNLRDTKILHRKQWLCLSDACLPDHMYGSVAELPEFLRG